MACHFLFILGLIVLFPLSSQAELTPNYYENSCPNFHDIMQPIVMQKQLASPTTAAATIRLFFHDCMVEGCDGSVLIASNTFKESEHDAEINHSLHDDAFDVVNRVKIALELACPGVVSCSDILAVATRDLVAISGGPHYEIPLGRKDSLVSKAKNVEGNLPLPTMPITEMISMFESKGFSIQEMVALSGAHTLGFSHCKEFSNRLFNFSETSEIDPAYNPAYALALRKLCMNYKTLTFMSAFNDAITPGIFDSMYYRNLRRGMGLLESDNALWVDPRTKPFVNMYASDQSKFFEDFGRAMQKISEYKIKTNEDGEVRSRCDAFNQY